MTLESMKKFYKISHLSSEQIQYYSTIPLEYWNPNPGEEKDCVVRSVSKLLNKSTDITKQEIIFFLEQHGFKGIRSYKDPIVYGSFLIEKYNYKKLELIRSSAMDGYAFCQNFFTGKFLVRVEGHVYCVINGCAFDEWNALGEIITDVWCFNEQQETQNIESSVENMYESYLFWSRR